MGILQEQTQQQPQQAPMPQQPPQQAPMPQQPQGMMAQQQQGPQQEVPAQEAHDKFVINGMKILHSPEVSDKIINRIKGSDDTVKVVGESAIDIVMRLEQSAGENQFPITANTIVNGLNAIVGEVITLAEAAGASPLSDEQKYQAYSWALGKYLDQGVKSGKITQEQLVQLGQEAMTDEAGANVGKHIKADVMQSGGAEQPPQPAGGQQQPPQPAGGQQQPPQPMGGV